MSPLVSAAAPPVYAEFTEEHNVDEIESIDIRPPKFVQVHMNSVLSHLTLLCRESPAIALCVGSNWRFVLKWTRTYYLNGTPNSFIYVFCARRQYNDLPLPTNGRYRVEEWAHRQSVLTVDNAEQGIYKCRAVNGAGAATSYGYVTVLGERI
jgi:hypothetical protein